MTQRVWFIAAVLVAILASQDARAQSADAPIDPLAAATAAMTQLDQLRAVEANQPQRVLNLLKAATDALTQARKRLADDVPAPSTAPAGRSRKTDAAANSAAVQQRRLGLCQIAFMQAELHRRAAIALPADHPERAKLLELSLAQSKALRVDYRDLVAGRLGYAGEARVHRARGDLPRAEAALANVAIGLSEKRLAQQPPAVMQVQRILWLERVETAFARSASAGDAMARELTASALMTDATPAERAALKFITATAAANAVIETGANGAGDADEVAQQLRDPALADATPEHQRLSLLVKLAARRRVALSISEQLRWAWLQSAAGMTEAALETYAVATKADAADVPPADWIAYGSLLHGAGRTDRAADALAKGLASIPADSPQRVGALQIIAAGRVQAARGNSADAANRELAIDALWQLVEATPDAAVRADALRSWAHFHQQAGTLHHHLRAIDNHEDAVLADPYLCLLVSEAKWRAATSLKPDATAQPADLSQLGPDIRSNLTRLLPGAGPDLAPSLVLMIAHASAATPGGARAALDVLAQHESLIKPDAPATPQLLAMKLSLLIDLGLTAEAEALAGQLQQGGTVSTATSLKLADLLADRHAGADAIPPAARDGIVRLVSGGLAQNAKDDSYRDSALAGATTLLKVKAYSDAQQILEGLKSAGESVEKDAEVALLWAAALQGQGKVEDAQKILAAVALANPDAGDVHLATGRLQQQLQQWQSAAVAYRAARKQLRAGGAPWWQATIGLAESLQAQDNAAGARELLRVANAMYRSRAPASLLPRIDTLLKEPVSSADLRSGTGGRRDKHL